MVYLGHHFVVSTTRATFRGTEVSVLPKVLTFFLCWFMHSLHVAMVAVSTYGVRYDE